MRGNPAPVVPKKIIDLIKESENFAIFTHTHPDGDALGSLFAFADILRGFGKSVYCYLEEPVTHLYDFLPDCENVSTQLKEFQQFCKDAGSDIVGVALDCGDEDRLGKDKDLFLTIDKFITIDHHRSHREFGQMRWVDDNRSSTGEMVFEIASELGCRLSYNAAYCLYVAICTDTGSFRYESTSSRTMAVAGELLDIGVKPDEVGSYLYDNYSPERLNLLQRVLATMDLQASGQVAIMCVTRQMLADTGASLVDVEGFIDFARALKSVKVAVMLKEASNHDISVSLRAKGDLDVAAVAKKFGGGGHRNAAGFKCPDKKIADVQKNVVDDLVEQLFLGS